MNECSDIDINQYNNNIVSQCNDIN